MDSGRQLFFRSDFFLFDNVRFVHDFCRIELRISQFGVVDEIFPTEYGAWKLRLKDPYNERRNPNTHILDINGAIFNYLVVHVKNEPKESKEDKAKKDDKTKNANEETQLKMGMNYLNKCLIH